MNDEDRLDQSTTTMTTTTMPTPAFTIVDVSFGKLASRKLPPLFRNANVAILNTASRVSFSSVLLSQVLVGFE